MSNYKTIPTQFSIYRKPSVQGNTTQYMDEGGNPIYNCIKIKMDSEGGGSFLAITDETDRGDGATVSFDWDEWDAVVEAVAEVRKDWEYE